MKNALWIVALLSLVACTSVKELESTRKAVEPLSRLEVLKPTSIEIEASSDISLNTNKKWRIKEDHVIRYDPPPFHAVIPVQRLRYDNRGDGHFGASRSGGRRTHRGIDIRCREGVSVYSPIEGVVTRKAYPYGDYGRNRKWEGCVIKGMGAYEGFEIKIFYMIPHRIGHYVEPGDYVGVSQAISKKYSRSMLDHLHVEVRWYGTVMNPATLFALS